MRISTQQLYSIANIGMSDAQRAIMKTEEQIATGKRVLHPSDDPVATTRILQLKEGLARSTQYQKNIDIAENTLELEETALDGVNTILQRARELAIKAGNTAVLTASDYKAIAAEVDSRLEELYGIANTRNAGGDYIFGGYQGAQQPMVADGGGGFDYRGDDGSRSIQISSIAKVQVSDSGRRIFQDIPSAANTINTSVNPANRATPPLRVSVGEVFDQQAFDAFQPRDMVVTFNALSNVSPAASNYTISERATGRVIVQNQVYQPGADIEVNGARFSINGNPVPGVAATVGTLSFGADAAQNYAGDETGETLSIRVGGVSETLTISSNITNDADLVTELTSGANATLLANLGVSINTLTVPPQFEVASGLNIEIDPNGGSGPNILAALGINSGTASSNGVPATAGDQVFIESSQSQGMLTTLARFSEALKKVKDGDTETKDFASAVIARTLTSIENAETQVAAVQSEIGARMNILESTRDLHLDSDLLNKEVMSDLEDLDYAEASTRLTMQSFILQAVQQTFVKVSGLSLFRLLG